MGRFRLKYLFSFYQNKEVDRTWHKIPVNYIRPGKKGNNYQQMWSRTEQLAYAQEGLSVKFSSEDVAHCPQEQPPIILEYCEQVKKPKMVKTLSFKKCPESKTEIQNTQLVLSYNLTIIVKRPIALL